MKSPSPKSGKYYTGSPKNLGKAYPSRAKSFSDLYNRYLFSPRVLSVERERFLSMGSKERQLHKRVDFICPCTFLAGSARKTENAGHANLVILDIDRAVDAAPLADSPPFMLTALEPFSFAAYHTASSTEESPKLRVIVEADMIDPEDYPDAVRMIANYLGVETNPESLDVVHLMYLPTVFKDSSRDDQPVFAFNLQGQPMTTEDIEFFRENQDLFGSDDAGTNLPRVQKKRRSKDFNDVLEFLDAPVDGVTLGVAEEVLKFLDPDERGDGADDDNNLSYHNWIRVGMALKHQFGDGEDAEDAFELFDKWSQTGTNDLYKGEKETRAKWRSFQVNAQGRRGVTFRSVLNEAKQRGWENTTIPLEEEYAQAEGVLTWLRAESAKPSFSVFQDVDKAISQYCRAVTNGSVMLDDAFGTKLLTICKDSVSDFKMSIGRVRKAISETRKAHIQADKLLKRPKNSEQMPSWLRGVAYVVSRGTFYSVSPPLDVKPGVFDDAYSSEMPKLGYALSESGRPMCLPSDYALNVVDIPRAGWLTFDPTAEGQTLIEQPDGSLLVNTYKDTRPTLNRSKKANKKVEEIINQHMDYLLEHDDHKRRLLDFISFLAQYPGEKIRWAPFIQGAQGCGKSVLHHVMECVLGEESCHHATGNAPFQQFTSCLEGKLFVMFDEVAYPRQIDTGGMGSLKSLMTDKTVDIEKKGIDEYQLPNRLNFMFVSNDMRSIPIADDDRRFFVLHSRVQTSKEAQRIQKTGHFDNMWELFTECPGAIRNFFERRPISNDFDINRAPDTQFKSQVVTLTSGKVRQYIAEILESSEDPLMSEDIIASNSLVYALRHEGFKGTKDTYHTDLMAMGFHPAPSVTLPKALRGERGGNPRRHMWVSPAVMERYNTGDSVVAAVNYLEDLSADMEVENGKRHEDED